MAYVTIANADIDPESPITGTLMTRLRDNPIEIMAKAAGAPVLANDYIVTAMIADSQITTAKIASNERITASNVGTAIAGQAAGDLGTEAQLVKLTANIAITAGTNYAGSDLGYFGINTDNLAAVGSVQSNVVGATVSGTWKAKGTTPAVLGRYSSAVFTKVAN